MCRLPTSRDLPSLRTTVSLAFLLLLLAAVGLGNRSLSAVAADRARTITVPFTLETQSYYFQGNPKGELGIRATIARRSDGTTVEIHRNRPGNPSELPFRIIKRLDGSRVQLADSIAAKTTWPAPSLDTVAWRRERLLHPPTNCVFANYEILLRNDTLLGHNVAVVSESYTDTVWRAPNLGCEVIQRRSGYKHDGAFKLQSEMRPLRLKRGEPDPRLFDEGAGYTELKPSELLRRVMAKAGIPWDANLQQEGERSDKIFFRNQ